MGILFRVLGILILLSLSVIASGDDEDLPEVGSAEAKSERSIVCMQSRVFSEILKKNAARLSELIELGADVRAMVYFGGETVLHAEARVGGAEVLQVFLNAGVPVDQVNLRGETPLHYAAGRGYYVAVVTLLRAGAAVDVLDSEGHTASDLARNADYQAVAGVIDLFRVNPGVRAEHLDSVDPDSSEDQSCFEAFLDAYFGGC